MRLKAVETLSTLPADFKGSNTTAEVKVHPSGKFVWVSNRGHNSLAGFAIAPMHAQHAAGIADDRKILSVTNEMRDVKFGRIFEGKRAAAGQTAVEYMLTTMTLVVAFAEPGGTVLTSNPDDLAALAAHAADVLIERI